MNPEPCPSPDAVRRLLLGGLPEAEAAPLERHLLSCSHCAGRMHALEAEDALAKGLRAQASPDEEVIDRLVLRLERLPIPQASPILPAEGCSLQTPLPGAPGAAAVPAPVVAGYEILGELGRGGMGVVYKARQTGLNRLTALKMILAGGHAGAEQLARFRREAEVVARLRHPNVVQIYEIGEAGGVPFFSLEFCSGGSLADRLRAGPLPPAEAAQALGQVASAVEAAHQAGVVHRDLKPANILLAFSRDPEGSAGPDALPSGSRLNGAVLKVTDFGLAKRLDVAGGQTQSGDLLGTPSYMAPEQARGRLREVGPAADVYALGALLYELVTGRPPFKGATIVDTLELVLHADPVPPRQLQPKCPRDLETICLTCLRKEPARRYPSAGALAEDLRRFLNREPIRARRAPAWEHLLKWVKRRPAVAALTALCLLACAALLGLGFVFSARMGAARGDLLAEEARTTAAEARTTAAEARTTAANQLAEAEKFFGLLRAVEKRGTRPEPGWTWANLAALKDATRMAPAAKHRTELRGEAATALGSIDVRPAGVVHLKILGQGADVRCLAFHPKGRYLALGQDRASGFAFCHVALYDLGRKGKPRLLSFAPTASTAFSSLLKGSQEGVVSLAFSPDGRWLVGGTRYGALQCWDLSSNPPRPTSAAGHTDQVYWLAFAPDGSALFTGGRDKVVKRWSFPALKVTARETTGKPVAGLAVHPTEGWAVCAAEPTTQWLSGDTLRPLGPPLGYWYGRVCFSPDGRSLLWHFGGIMQLRDLRNVSVVRELAAPGGELAHDGDVSSLAFSPDGSLILSASSEAKQARLWETASGRLLADLPVAGVELEAAFHPDGRSFAVTAGTEARLYEIGGLRETSFRAGGPYPVATCALHPDGRSLACLTRSFLGETYGEVSVWPLANRPPAAPPAVHTFAGHEAGFRHSLAFHPLSQALALARPKRLRFWGPQGEKTLGPLPGPADGPALSFAPEGRLWATVGGEVQARELPDGRLAARWSSESVRRMTGASDPLCVAAGRRWVAAGGNNGLVYLLRGAGATAAATPRVADNPVRAVALAADESVAAAGTDRGELCLLRVPGGEVLTKVAAHRDRLEALAFAGKGLLASGGRDRSVRLWHWDGGSLKELLTLRVPGPVRWLALHPDGVRLFVLLDRERAVRVWHLDRLRARLDEMGLGDGLQVIEAGPLPLPAPSPPPPAPVVEAPHGQNGLRAELFADIHLRRCVKVRHDAQVNFDWGEGSPDPLVPKNFFSARWAGWLKAPRAGRYTLRLEVNDGARLWLDGKLRIDLWQAGPRRSYQAEVELTDRPHEIRVEYFQIEGAAAVRLSWAQKDGFALQPIPPGALFHEQAAAEKAVLPPAGR